MSPKLTNSQKLLDRARQVTPGGVHSYARTSDQPICFDRSHGSKIVDVDGNEYIDYLNSWGAIILGHCNEAVNEAVSDAIKNHDLSGVGTTELEVTLSEEIVARVPSAEKVLFGLSGSEVVAKSVMLARAVTDRRKIIKFQGTYHGWYDAVAMNHQTPKENLGTRDMYGEGILPEATEDTIVLPFNDIEAVETAFQTHEDEIAAIILEPVAHNMGCILPRSEYLQRLRELTSANGALLIFDEVITGFRHSMGGIQALEGITPDLTTMAKAVANGYPIAILCGKSEYMNQFQTAENGTVTWGGTYNAHPASLAAALRTIDLLEEMNFHEEGTDQAREISTRLRELVDDIGLDAQVIQFGPTYLTYFTDQPLRNWEDIVEHHDSAKYRRYREYMIDHGVYMVPKEARRNFISASHTQEDIETTIQVAKKAFEQVAD